MEAPLPLLISCRKTVAPAAFATSPVQSVEPSSTTTTRLTRGRVCRTTSPNRGSSLKAGISAMTTGLLIRLLRPRVVSRLAKRDRRGQRAILLNVPRVVEQIPLFAVAADHPFHCLRDVPHQRFHRVPRWVGPDWFLHDVSECIVWTADHEHG